MQRLELGLNLLEELRIAATNIHRSITSVRYESTGLTVAIDDAASIHVPAEELRAVFNKGHSFREWARVLAEEADVSIVCVNGEDY